MIYLVSLLMLSPKAMHQQEGFDPVMLTATALQHTTPRTCNTPATVAFTGSLISQCSGQLICHIQPAL